MPSVFPLKVEHEADLAVAQVELHCQGHRGHPVRHLDDHVTGNDIRHICPGEGASVGIDRHPRGRVGVQRPREVVVVGVAHRGRVQRVVGVAHLHVVRLRSPGHDRRVVLCENK